MFMCEIVFNMTHAFDIKRGRHLFFRSSFFVFKALFTEFCNCACAKKVIRLIRIRHTCVALIHKKTVLPLETSSEINF